MLVQACHIDLLGHLGRNQGYMFTDTSNSTKRTQNLQQRLERKRAIDPVLQREAVEREAQVNIIT